MTPTTTEKACSAGMPKATCFVPRANLCGRQQPGRIRTGIDAGNVLEVSATGTGGPATAKGALVGVHRAHCGPVSAGAFAEHDPHPFASLIFAELLDAFRDLSWGIDAQESLVPRTRIQRLIHVAPLVETGDGGGVDSLVELCATVVPDAVFDGGDDENEEERKGSGGGRGGAKDGKDWEASGGECVNREALTLEHDEGEKVNVGYSAKNMNWWTLEHGWPYRWNCSKGFLGRNVSRVYPRGGEVREHASGRRTDCLSVLCSWDTELGAVGHTDRLRRRTAGR